MAIKALTEAMAATSTGDPLRAAYVAMMLGQRVSDVLRLKRENVFIQHFAKHTDTQQSVHTVVLKFVETNTSLKCGHFTLAIPYGTHVATLLIEDRSCSTEEYFYISNRVEVLKAEAEIHKKLLEILGFKVDLRAMRRTGLSRFASSGAELSRYSKYDDTEPSIC
ncbi:Hypothetical protein, putative [Bodo saltans]|uniref:Uncharacterized protein n=1 Tax=Bodo saltans TaxID=75058 RepID=A0A0S4IWP4_BODSA|nr:Hypothetical protein, putative [Bodo saltans]|eukprot:CUG06332.1 Hypothetical protein, putative [Bodo saltans]